MKNFDERIQKMEGKIQGVREKNFRKFKITQKLDF